ncbi:MAG: HEAT repeat domain-containing protein [Pseudomonadota bacterium]|nr:MAG: HEAT repeat domain-containing protein [Pseudomonadota bacterium]
MGLFDLFKKKGEPAKPSERELQRLERLVGSKLSQNIDRQEAIEALSRMGTRESAAALLKRFDWQLDPSITDQEEKEACLRAIVAVGEEALEPVRAYCQRAESLMWPIKVLKGIVSGEALTDELLALLDRYDTEYIRNPEPKVQLITELAEHKTDEVRTAVEPFLQDASEPVRFAAVTTLFSIGSEHSIPALVAALDEEESRRVKNRIAQGLQQHGWVIPEELREVCARGLTEEYRLTDGRVVPAR